MSEHKPNNNTHKSNGAAGVAAGGAAGVAAGGAAGGAGGVQGKLSCPFKMEIGPGVYRNTGELRPDYLDSLAQGHEILITNKIDGGCCYLSGEGIWYLRIDIKIPKKNKALWTRRAKGELTESDFQTLLEDKKKTMKYMEEWIPSCPPDLKSGHWPGWLPVTPQNGSKNPHASWALKAIEAKNFYPSEPEPGQTYELIGVGMQGNPYGLSTTALVRHGSIVFSHLETQDILTSTGLFSCFETPELMGAEGMVIWIDGRPRWKIHHGHIRADGNTTQDKDHCWKSQILIPTELTRFVRVL